MPPVSEMTDEQVIAKCRNQYTFGGAASDHMHELLVRALPLVPDDPIVNGRALELWYYFAMPVDDGYSSSGPNREEGISLHRQALENAERIVAGTAAFDTAELRALYFWAKQTRMMLRLTAPSVTAEDLAIANVESDAVYDEILDKPHVGDEEKRIKSYFRVMGSARLRSLQLLDSGQPYPEATVDMLRGYLASWEWNFGWPVAPLTRDAAARAWFENELEVRTQAKAHPAPPLVMRIARLVDRDPADPAELDGRVLLLLWLGIDERGFLAYASEVIEKRLPLAILERLLSLGFDVNGETADGGSLLHTAVDAGNTDAIRRLLGAGANPNRKREGVTVLAHANAKKRTAVLKALAGAADDGPSAAEAEIAAALRAVASALSPRDLVWIGSTFGVMEPKPAALVEIVLAKRPETAQEILDDITDWFVFDRYVVARVLRDAGYVIDGHLTGLTVLERNLTFSGSLTIDGDVFDALNQAGIVVANDLVIHGGFVTEADTIVGGTLRVRDYVWGVYNDGSLVVDVGVTTPVLVMPDHTFECEGEVDVERIAIADRQMYRTIFVPDVLNEHGMPMSRTALELVKQGKPVLLDAAPAKEPAK